MLAEAIERNETGVAMTAEQLVEAYFDEIYRFASRRLRREDAEDATAETFQAALSHLNHVRREELRLWLLGIARRKVASHLRRWFRRREEQIPEGLAGTAPKSAEAAEAEAQVRRIVLSLPRDQRDALLMQHLEELTVAEIAKVMGRSESSVTNLLYRARIAAYKKGRAYFAVDEEKP